MSDRLLVAFDLKEKPLISLNDRLNLVSGE